MIARIPVRSELSSCARSKPSRLSISAWSRMRSVVEPSPMAWSIGSSAAKGSSGGVWNSSAMARDLPGLVSLADQHLLDEHRVNFRRRDDKIHPSLDFRAQLVAAL